MKKAIGIRGIPHCIVMSSDWTVRWQGHPTQLKTELLQQIVDADAGANPAANAPPRRWAKDRA